MKDTQRCSPYQGLDPFDEKDAPFFFGREKETRLIIANLFASSLTILYGASGVGKSSVLRAGVAYQLHQRDDILVVVFGTWQGNPIAALKRAIANEASRVPNEIEPPSDSLPLAEYLSAWAQKLNHRIMLILDQFEEYFLYHPQDDVFALEFPKAVTRRDLPISFLIAIREDSVAKLDQFKGRIPGLFDNYLRLEHLDREAATVAIVEPVKTFYRLQDETEIENHIEPGLADAVIEQVKTGQVFVGDVGLGRISTQSSEVQVETPYLQLVMTRLWEEEARRNSCVLRVETLNRLGEARSIVQTHLDKAMESLSSNERDIAARILHYLVTPSGTKIAHTPPDLAKYADSSEEEILSVLDKLSSGNTRIFRTVATPNSKVSRYEIFHDVLAPAILDWRARYVQEKELQREIRLKEGLGDVKGSYKRTANKFLIVCGGAGVGLLGQRRVLGVNAELQIDVSAEMISAKDPQSLGFVLDGQLEFGSVAQLLFDMKTRVNNETPSAAKRHTEILADQWITHAALRDGLARSPALGGGIIRHQENRRALEATLSRMIDQFATNLSSDNPLDIWIVSSTAGGTGEGTHRFVATTLTEIMKSKYPVPVRLNFIRIGPFSYRSVDPVRTRLNTFLGIAADAAFALKCPKDNPAATTNWFYVDLPDVGVGSAAKPIRAKIAELAAKAIMLDELTLSLSTLLTNEGLRMVLARVGFWGRDFDEKAKYYWTLRQLIEKLKDLVEPDYFSKYIKGRALPMILTTTSLQRIKEDLMDEKYLLRKIGSGWRFPKFNERFGAEDRIREWKRGVNLIDSLDVDEVASLTKLEIVAPQGMAWETKAERRILSISGYSLGGYGNWFEKITDAQLVKAWSEELLLRRTSEQGSEGLVDRLTRLARTCSDIQYGINPFKSTEGRARELSRLLPSFVEALVRVVHLSQLKIIVDQVLRTEIATPKKLLDEALRQEKLASHITERADISLVIAAELSDRVDLLREESWLRLLERAYQQADAQGFRQEVLRGAIGLTREGLLSVLGLRLNANIEEIKYALDERMGRMVIADRQEFEAQWWQATPPSQVRAEFSYRILPILEPQMRGMLGGGTERIQYLYTGLGAIGLYILALQAALVGDPLDTVATPAYLIRPFAPIVRQALQNWPGEVVPGRHSGQVEIAAAGVVGEPLYEGVLRQVGLSDEEVKKIGELYELYNP